MIEVSHLTKVYGTHAAVHDLSFKFPNGSIYGFLGPNGAGKSTTMNILTGCLAPTSGTVKINGFDITLHPEQAKKCIGYLPEIPPLWGEMTPFEYLMFVAEAKGVSYEYALRQVEEAMENTGIGDLRDRLICNLSKGTRQRVGIAQALLGNPDILILDEPTVGLDPKQISEIRSLIRSLAEKKTVILSSHILAEIEEVCDQVLIISKGELVAFAPLEELRENNSSARLHLSVRGDEAGILDTLGEIPELDTCTVRPSLDAGVVNLTLEASASEDLRDKIFFALADRRYALLSMEKEENSLENIFLKLTEDSASAKKPKRSSAEGEYEILDDGDEKEGGDKE